MKSTIDCLLIGYSGTDIEILKNPDIPFFDVVKRLSKPFNAAIAYIGTYLNIKGFTFHYINSFEDEKDLLKRYLANNTYLTIGISTTFCTEIEQVNKITDFIRENSPDSKIILGGPFITLYVRTSLQYFANKESSLRFITQKVHADYIITSFLGENLLVELLTALKENKDINDIPYILYSNGNIFHSTDFSVKEEHIMHSTYVDWSLFKNPAPIDIPIRTSISCPFSCSFCNFHINMGKYKFLDIDEIEKTLNSIESIGNIHSIRFTDDTLNIPASRFKNLLKMMIRNKYSFKWYSYIRCQYVDEETAALMSESGCLCALLGIESGNQEMLQNMNKSAKVEDYYHGISLLNKYNIMTVILLFVGFPGETDGSVMDTVNFLNTANPAFYTLEPWFFDPRTPIANEREKFGIKGEYRKWSHNTMDYKTAVAWVGRIPTLVNYSTFLKNISLNVLQLFHLGLTMDDIKDVADYISQNHKNPFI